MTNKAGNGRKPSSKSSEENKQPPRENEDLIRKAKPTMLGGCYVVENGKVNAKPTKAQAKTAEAQASEETE